MYYAATDEILAEIIDEMDVEPAEASGILDSLLAPADATDEDLEALAVLERNRHARRIRGAH